VLMVCMWWLLSRVFNMGGDYKSMAVLMNQWWVKGAPMATAAVSGSSFMDGNPYYEVMLDGNALLPEDLSAIIAKYSNSVTGGVQSTGAPGLWGTKLGAHLRDWMVTHKRPLIWADRIDGPMLIDPIVARGVGFGFSAWYRVTAADRALFESAWAAGVPPATRSSAPGAGLTNTGSSFDMLAAQAAPHLHFHWQSWVTKEACDAQETNGSVVVIGTDEDGDCVFWAKPQVPHSPRWECVNDGTCQIGTNPEFARFSSEAECASHCASRWACTRITGSRPFAHASTAAIVTSWIPNANRDHVAYCLPSPNATTTSGAGGAAARALPHGATLSYFSSADACELACTVDDLGRDWLCVDWQGVVTATLILWTLMHCFGFCAVNRYVMPRQRAQFKAQASGCFFCRVATGRPMPSKCCFCIPLATWSNCLFMTFCPCLNCFRVLGFLYGKCCGWCGCILFIIW
jgi:hypothetical protein